MTTGFAELGLSEKTLAAVAGMGYVDPTPVQEAAIPLVLAGRDVIAAAQTGTGKTAAFLLPVMDGLGHGRRVKYAPAEPASAKGAEAGAGAEVGTETSQSDSGVASDEAAVEVGVAPEASTSETGDVLAASAVEAGNAPAVSTSETGDAPAASRAEGESAPTSSAPAGSGKKRRRRRKKGSGAGNGASNGAGGQGGVSAQSGAQGSAQSTQQQKRKVLKRAQGPLCLIVTPTRELAQQIDAVATTVAKKTGHKVLTVVGGTRYDRQIDALREGVDILVATPGRLIDLMERKALRLDDVSVLVLDEADRMLDMGFWPSVKKIVARCDRRKQTLLFSATITDKVQTSAKPLMGEDPAFVEVAVVGTTAENIDQVIMPVDSAQKTDLLLAVLRKQGAARTLVFTRTKLAAEQVATRLKDEGFKVQAIHSDRNQRQREQALAAFKSGKLDMLVATDVLARGIDISDVAQVINYNVPEQPEDYVHRIGRTGRAGESGNAITLVGPDELHELRQIEFLTKKVIPTWDLPDFDYRDTRIVPSPDRTAKKRDPRKTFGPRGRR